MELPVSFIWPSLLPTLLLLVPFGLWYAARQRRRRRLMASYGGPAPAQGHDPRRHLPAGILLAGLGLLLLSLARPQMVVSLPRIEGTVILAFDVSRSMAAEDLAPTRLAAAQAAAREFVVNQPPGVLVGVVAFSDSGFVVQVPTSEQEAVLVTIDRLAPERGTSLANGILAALNMIAAAERDVGPRRYSNLPPEPTPTPTPAPPGSAPAVIVLLTDGENNEDPDPLEAARVALYQGVRIHTVGVGSAAGATLDIDGFGVHSQLDEALLQRIAGVTGGEYFSAQSEQELRAIYQGIDPQWVVRPDEIEITSVLAGVAILVLLIGGTLSLLWLGRLP